MAIARAIFVAVSLVVLTAIYSEISNYEEELASRKTSEKPSEIKDSFVIYSFKSLFCFISDR